ncbi:MAG: elongation factor Ts [Clostridia bacterium]|nr:elongation factor Ts [Clostridiales bacterium]MBQ3505374.1 elongation factor Ts [Clostridia bacterium]
MAFTAKDVMALREKTGAGVMDCKKALTDADGDMQKAADLLRERGIAKAEKKASRIAAEGIVACYIDGKFGVLVELNCESDFVAKNPQFTEIATEVSKVIVKENPANVDALLACACVGGTVEEYLKSKIAIIGEKIAVRRFVRYETTGFLASYIHLGGKLGVMLDVAGDESDAAKEVAHDITLQIAFTKPAYLTKDEVSAETLEKEKAVLKQQAMNEGKPEAIAEKMVMGRIKKFYDENCLLEQAFIKDDSKKIGDLLKAAGVSVNKFAFFVMGEGLEKKSEDLSEEVAKQVAAAQK